MEKPACLRAAATLPEPEDPSENDPERRSLPDVDFRKVVEVPADTQLASLTLAERQKQARRNRKQERFDLVRTMHEEGLSMRELGRQVNMSYRTVSKYLQADSCPFYPGGLKRGQSKLDPFLDYLTTRWQEGCHNASQLFREIQQRGFDGSRGLVARWTVGQRQQLPSTSSTTQRKARPQQSRVIPWRTARTAWLLFSCEDDLDEDDQLALERIKLADTDVALAHQFVQAFQQMVRDQQPNQLTSWLQDVTDSGIVALKSFVNGVRQDLAAMTNALSSPWSNGLTEGQVNRLKFIKQQPRLPTHAAVIQTGQAQRTADKSICLFFSAATQRLAHTVGSLGIGYGMSLRAWGALRAQRAPGGVWLSGSRLRAQRALAPLSLTNHPPPYDPPRCPPVAF